MNLTVVVPPAVEPVTVAQVYEHLRWDVEYEGSPLEPVYPLEVSVRGYITTARTMVEKTLKRSLVKQTLRLSTGSFFDMELLRPPFIELLTVAYMDEAGVQQIMDLDDFFVTEDVVPKLQMYSRGMLGCRLAHRADAVRVTYEAGYLGSGSPADLTDGIPQNFKDAILLQVQLLADRFDPNEKEDLERSYAALLSVDKVYTF